VTDRGARQATASTRAVLQVEHFTTPAGSWNPAEATLTAKGTRFVKHLRGKLIAVAKLRCDGYDANVRPGPGSSAEMSLARAKTLCAALGLHVRPRLVGHADADPIASNATEPGRAANRRVEVTVTHAPRRLPR
jgi:flagellar motor protein MotB